MSYSYTMNNSSNYVSVTANSTAMDSEFEGVERPDTGESEECNDCPHDLSCLAGVISKAWMVAGTREDHRTGVRLPCVDGGETKLVPIRLKQRYTFTPDVLGQQVYGVPTHNPYTTTNVGSHTAAQQSPVITWSSNVIGSNTK